MMTVTKSWSYIDAPPHSLKDSNASSKVKTMKEKKIGVCFLARNTLKIEGRVGALRWGLERLTSESII